MNQFPLSFSESDIEQAKAGISPSALEYIERLEWVARTATGYMQHTTAYTSDAYRASMNLSAALSRITLVRPAKSWHEFVTSGKASNDPPPSHSINEEEETSEEAHIVVAQLGDGFTQSFLFRPHKKTDLQSPSDAGVPERHHSSRANVLRGTELSDDIIALMSDACVAK